MVELVNGFVQRISIPVFCPYIIPEFTDQINGILCHKELPSLHPLQLEFQLVLFDRSILVARYYIESGILDVSDGFWFSTIRIDLHPIGDSILLEILDDVLVLHVCPVAPLPHPGDLLPRICDHLHPEALFHHDDWGTENNSFLRPEMFADYFVEPYKEIYGYYHDHGVEFVFHHNDSYSANLVPYMIEMGIDVWQGNMESNDTKAMLEKYKGQIAFMGNIDNKDVDFHGWTPEDVKRVAYEHLDGYDFQSYIPCITQGGPGSTFSGTYVELCKYIDQYNCEKFGFTQQEIEDARLPLQVIFG